MGSKQSNEGKELTGAYVDLTFMIQRGQFIVPLCKAIGAQFSLGMMKSADLLKAFERVYDNEPRGSNSNGASQNS